jgi:hypothetical protein
MTNICRLLELATIIQLVVLNLIFRTSFPQDLDLAAGLVHENNVGSCHFEEKMSRPEPVMRNGLSSTAGSDT